MNASSKSAFLFMVLLLSLAGCVSAISQKESEMHFEAAHRADVQGDYFTASEQYWRALITARHANAGNAEISMLMYNFGRTSGYICHLDQAEKYLTEALNLEKTVSGPESNITSMRIFELARFNYDQGNFEKSAYFYGLGIPLLQKFNFAKSDPIAFADIYEEYADILAKTGSKAQESEFLEKARYLRNSNPGQKVKFLPKRYRCAR